MKKKYTYSNDFHNTEYKSVRSPDEIEEWRSELMGDRPPAWLKNLAHNMSRKLCGIKGCTCGDEFGRR